jgi:hypothetical protein
MKPMVFAIARAGVVRARQAEIISATVLRAMLERFDRLWFVLLRIFVLNPPRAGTIGPAKRREWKTLANGTCRNRRQWMRGFVDT